MYIQGNETTELLFWNQIILKNISSFYTKNVDPFVGNYASASLCLSVCARVCDFVHPLHSSCITRQISRCSLMRTKILFHRKIKQAEKGRMIQIFCILVWVYLLAFVCTFMNGKTRMHLYMSTYVFEYVHFIIIACRCVFMQVCVIHYFNMCMRFIITNSLTFSDLSIDYFVSLAVWWRPLFVVCGWLVSFLQWRFYLISIYWSWLKKDQIRSRFTESIAPVWATNC